MDTIVFGAAVVAVAVVLYVKVGAVKAFVDGMVAKIKPKA